MKVVPENKWLIGVVSAGLIGSAALWEGTKYTPYLDVVGVPTVCSGYTGKDIVWGKKYSPSECSAYLKKELGEHSSGVLNCIQAPLKENEYNAFTLMAYNVGVKAFCGSSTVRLFNAGLTKEACNAIAFTPKGQPNWSFAGGKFYKGLFNRRLYERSMCLGDKVLYAS
jgi:lysozyme